MRHKSAPLDITQTNPDTGEFTATVAVFGNVDLGGDRIIPGAFSKSIRSWKAAGDPVPVIWNHDHDNPMAHIGVVDPADMTETPKGLQVKGTLDVADNEVARQVHRLMKRRSVKEFSFGYQVPRGGEKRANDGANELHEISLFELGPTLKGMNPSTELHAVKSALGERRKMDAPSVRLINSMAGQARKFIDSEDDADDIATMRHVLEMLVELGAAESSEPAEPAGEKHLSPSSTEPPESAAPADETKHSDPPRTAADPLITQTLNYLLDLESAGVERKSPPVNEPPSNLLTQQEAERRYWAEQIEFLTS